jgi:hypothetical protein
MRIEILEKQSEWQARLEEWGMTPFSLTLQQTCKEPYWEGANYIVPPLELLFDDLTVQIIGVIPQATHKGLISLYDDNITGTLKIWPEALATAVALNAPEIWMLKNGKNKSFQNPYENLKAFVHYYFQALSAPSLLLPDWADLLLRKKTKDLQELLEKKSYYEDPIMQWVLARAELPLDSEMCESWSLVLEKTFKSLVELYKGRAER